MLADPAFEALPGATADFGRLGGAVYQIEMPDDWNGRLVLHMHGFEEFAPEASVTSPDFRRYLIGHGYAWGASSFSSTSFIPGRSTDETAALWDYFVGKYGRPDWTYVTGISMGGASTHIAVERYPDRFDGGLALCGNTGQTAGSVALADYFAAGAYVAGVTQDEFDASTDRGALIEDRIRPVLEDPAAHERWESIMLDLQGGPRAFDREGFRIEEDTNWRRAAVVVASGLAPNAGRQYELGPLSDISSEEFNRDVVRLPVNEDLFARLIADGDVTGDVQVPLLSLHTTGDGQVPIGQARILQQLVDAADKSDLLVQWIIRDPGHCGFTTGEQEAALETLVSWVEEGDRPEGHDVLVDDLRTLSGDFELSVREGAPGAGEVEGAGDRVVVSGNLTLDGVPFDANYLGAIVRKDGLIAACQHTLPPVEDGRYEITVVADAEVSGCGAPGSEILLWVYAQEQLFSSEWVPWPEDGRTVSFDGDFSTSAPEGAAPARTQFNGELYDRNGDRLPAGTRIEAYIGDTLCGVTSVRRSGSFGGFIMSVVGPDSVPGCERGATIEFRADGKRAIETAANELEPGGGGRGGGGDLTLE
jgi:pimeloyl-ACP methyl ester carboxylesterase